MSLVPIYLEGGAGATVSEYTFSYSMRAETGAGWLPFVFEREFVVDLSPLFDRGFEVVGARLSVSVTERRLISPVGEPAVLRVYVNGNKVVDRAYVSGAEVVVDVPVLYISRVVQIRVEYGADSIIPIWSQGAVCEATLYVTARKVGRPEEVAEEAREAYVESLISSYEHQGYTVEEVRTANGAVYVTVTTPEGKTEEKADWFSMLAGLPQIILIVFFILILIEIVRLIRR
jgi:hypothetical protein